MTAGDDPRAAHDDSITNEATTTSRVGTGISTFPALDTGGGQTGLLWLRGEPAEYDGLVMTFTFRPIGFIRAPFTDRSQIPKGPSATHVAEGVIEVLPELAAGLTDIDGFSHLYVLWVFDQADPGVDLLTTPPNDDRPHGVFATRAPRRPNPIGLSIVESLGRTATGLRVRGLDMLDGTPVLDIKPYLSGVPDDRLQRGWLVDAEARGAKSEGTGY